MKLFLFVALALVGLAAAVPAELDITNTEERQDETFVGLAAEVPNELDITNPEERQVETFEDLEAEVPNELDITNPEERQVETFEDLEAEVPNELDITNPEERQDDAFEGLEAELPTELDITSTEELQDETAVSSDRSGLLVRRQFIASGAANTVRVVNYTFRGLASTRITRWQVLRVGAAQGATATRTGGGVNTNFLSIRFQSARGRGFNYILEIFGR